MDSGVLAELGLTPGEVKVYLALNRLGQATVGPIAKESCVTKSKVYDILERLIEKGLAGSVTKGGVRSFLANDPHALLDYLERKESELAQTRKSVDSLLTQLLQQRASAPEPRIAELYEGFRGMKAVREELLGTLVPGEPLLVLGAPRIANEKWEGWLLGFHRRRISRGVPMKIIYNADAREYGKKRERMRLTEVRYLPNQLVSPNWIDVFPNAVLFVLLLRTPTAFVVRDKEFADSFRAYFEIMWKAAKP